MMLATPISWVFDPAYNWLSKGRAGRVRLCRGLCRLLGRLTIWAIGFNLFVQTNSAQTNSVPDEKSFAVRAERIFLAARKRVQAEPQHTAAAWQFARACFDWAEFARNDAQREEIAREGIAACRQAIAREPKLAPAHYFLAMNLGQVARTKLLGALTIVDEMEREFKIVRTLDEKFDYAGPDRNLGLLYLESPGWPTSIGNRGKARQHLQRAAELSPDYPENQLNLAETYLKWRERKNFLRQVKILEELWPQAHKKFVGELWETSWMDWEARWAKIKTKAAEDSKPAESP